MNPGELGEREDLDAEVRAFAQLRDVLAGRLRVPLDGSSSMMFRGMRVARWLARSGTDRAGVDRRLGTHRGSGVALLRTLRAREACRTMPRAAACARTHGALRSAGLRPLLDFQTTAVRAHAQPPTLAVHGRPCCAQGRLPKLREPSRKLPKQKLSTTKARGQRTSRAPSSVEAHAHRSCRKRRRISRTNERTRTAALERDRASPRYPATPKACHRRGLAPGRELPSAGDRWSRLA